MKVKIECEVMQEASSNVAVAASALFAMVSVFCGDVPSEMEKFVIYFDDMVVFNSDTDSMEEIYKKYFF